MPQTTMTKVKDCKGSVPFRTTNTDAPVGTIYVGRTHALSKDVAIVQTWDETTITFKSGV